MLDGKRVMVTGGAGAIGAAVVRALARRNQVTVLDNLSSGARANLDGVDCRLIVGDIANPKDLARAFEEPYDVVIHLAAHFANQNSIEHPVPDLTANAVGTLALLEACRASMPRFVYASSSCIYGQGIPPFREHDTPLEFHTPYAVSKYAGELYTRLYEQYYGMETLSLRFFNNFGPHDPPGRYRNVIPNFIVQAHRSEPLVITGTGDETRDFTYCENTVDAILRAASVPYTTLPEVKVFNVGSGRETSIRTLAESIVAALGSSSTIMYQPRRGWDHAERRCADISLARRYLGYEPAISFEEGIARTVAWFLAEAESLWT